MPAFFELFSECLRPFQNAGWKLSGTVLSVKILFDLQVSWAFPLRFSSFLDKARVRWLNRFDVVAYSPCLVSMRGLDVSIWKQWRAQGRLSGAMGRGLMKLFAL